MRILLLFLLMCMMHSARASEGDLFDAAREGDTARIEQYVRIGQKVNLTNEDGYTPFILATYHGHVKAAATLLAHGADACATDPKGSNAFMGVAFKGHLAMAEWLLAHTSCNINHQNNAGQTALMMASLFGHDALVKLFIHHKADPAIIDHSGNTAASLARGQGLSHIVDMVRFHTQ